jgi:predicted Zn finger-like uncharacterized protein
MKVSCQSCGAKYTIADDKVRGRKVKIRCKSCGSPIVVDGQSEAPPPVAEAQAETSANVPSPPTADAWTVNLSDTDQRTMSTQEIVEGWKSGLVTTDAFVWKDGMGDWTAVLEHPDLKPLLAAAPAAAVAAPVVAAAPTAGAPASIGGAARLAGTGRSAATGAVDLFGGVDVAGSEEEEEVATSAPVVPQAGATAYDDGKLTGARNENSVLFSLDALKGGLTAEPKKAPSASKPKSSPLDFGGPDLLAAQAPSPIFSLNADQALLTAPAPPEPPPPKVVSAVGTTGSGGPSKMMLIGGAVGALLLIGVAFALGRSGSSDEAKDDGVKPAASVAEAKTTEKEPEKTEEKKEEPKAEEPKPEASAAVSASAAPTSAPVKPGPATPSDKKPSTPTTPKETKEPAPVAATGPFSVSAAQVALTQAAGNAQGCKKPDGPTGSGKVQVTFAPSGRVTSANVNGAPFAGTPVGGCVASAFRRARIPAFTGNPVTVAKSFSVR